MTSSKQLLWGALLGCAIGGATVLWPIRALPESSSINLPIESVVDYIHAVIEADRAVYTRHSAERMPVKGVVGAPLNWEDMTSFALPVQFLQESGRYVSKKGLGLQYRLISSWPINKGNVATNALEATALGAVVTNPDRPYKGVTKIGDTRYYEAVYADLAVTHACIGCHNIHPDSPKRDFKVNDVMGAIVISVQLGE